MNDFTFSTGREYGTPQVIEVSDIVILNEEFGVFEFTARFTDVSRGIGGTVDGLSFGNTEACFAEAVMAEYDACRYN